MKNKILLIKTHGCSACKCMENILYYVEQDIKDFIIESIYTNDIPEYIKINVPLHDFPTTVILDKNGTIKYHFSGTKSYRKILSLISDLGFQ
uniref:Thioredoxin n=1 Tax=Geladintestivirus 2 TaxID=3233134 RepID=A0AAU8MIQ4_9CAUD